MEIFLHRKTSLKRIFRTTTEMFVISIWVIFFVTVSLLYSIEQEKIMRSILTEIMYNRFRIVNYCFLCDAIDLYIKNCCVLIECSVSVKNKILMFLSYHVNIRVELVLPQSCNPTVEDDCFKNEAYNISGDSGTAERVFLDVSVRDRHVINLARDLERLSIECRK